MNESVTPAERVKAELDAHGAYASNTVGSSMWPLFKTHRDVVIIAPVSEKTGEIAKFDVILYPGKNNCLLHRVVGEKDGVLLVRGDNTYRLEHIPRSAVIGRLESFTRKGKNHVTTERGYRAYVRFWNFLYPCRFVCHHIRGALSRLYHKLFGRKKA